MSGCNFCRDGPWIWDTVHTGIVNLIGSDLLNAGSNCADYEHFHCGSYIQEQTTSEGKM